MCASDSSMEIAVHIAFPGPTNRPSSSSKSTARDRNKQDVLPPIEDQTVRIGKAVHQQVQFSARSKTEDSSHRIVERTLARIGKVEIAVVGENQIVQPAEGRS